MTTDDGLLERARRTKAAMEAARAETRRAEVEYHQAVRRLHEAGASPEEVARGLDISDDAARLILGFDPRSGGLLRCSFCSKSQKEARKLISGPGVYICDDCAVAAAISTEHPPGGCSFCGRSSPTVRGLFSGPDVRICDECLDLCRQILEQERD